MKKSRTTSVVSHTKIFFLLILLIGIINISEANNIITSDTTILNEIGLPYNKKTKKIEYSDVISVDGANKNEIFNVAKEIIIVNSEKQQLYIITNDEDNSKFTVQSTFEVIYRKKSGNNIFHDVIYTLKIETKDGKYRYTITNFAVYNKEKHTAPAQYGTSGLLIGTGKSKTIPLEEFLSVESRRKDGAKIYNMFQDHLAEITDYLTYSISKELSANTDW